MSLAYLKRMQSKDSSAFDLPPEEVFLALALKCVRILFITIYYLIAYIRHVNLRGELQEFCNASVRYRL